MSWVRVGIATLLIAVVSGHAQEYRATLLGVITDVTGARVAGAKVLVINTETEVRSATESNNEGNYLVPYLPPGTYRLRVEHAGFKTFERSPIELRVNDRMRLDVELEVGSVSDRVTVTAESPLLEQGNADRGQVIENRQITDMPLNGRNPYVMMQLAGGAVYTGSLTAQRPFGEGSAYSINGGIERTNEFLLDGISNNENSDSSVVYIGYVPPVEATREVKVQTNTYDAQYGRTGGGVTNLSVKSGTNRLHGAVYEYMRRTALEANNIANNAFGKPRGYHVVDQYGFEFDGPVMLPKVYRGKDRTFFMFALERYREPAPIPTLGSVPTAEQRKGDFSQTFTSSGRLYTISDPLTSRANPAFDPTKPITVSNLQTIRTPFPGNQITQARMEPIALNVLKDIPLPTQVGDPTTHANNWFGSNVTNYNHFHSLIGRVDHTVNDVWRLFARASHSMRDEHNDGGWGTPASPAQHANRMAEAAAFDATGTLSPSTVVNARISCNHNFGDRYLYPPIDISSLGFPKALQSQLQIPNAYPVFNFENYAQAGSYLNSDEPDDTMSAQGTMLRTRGRHTMKFGTEIRRMHHALFGRATGAGWYQFTRGATSSNGQINDPNAGNAIASLLLGYLNSATAALNATPYQSWKYAALFFQDDWQVNRKLALSLGLRWDYESPIVERYNRQNRGFDFNAKSPYQVPGLDLRGGLLFAGVNGQPRGAYDPDWNNVQPRVGVAYRMFRSKPWVFRGGIGRSFLPTSMAGGNTGFSQTTSAAVATASDVPFRVLSNPFPTGLVQPPGSGRGLATQVGDSVSFIDLQMRTPNMWQYSAGFQYELVPGLLIEATYVGSQTRQLPVSKGMSFLTVDQLALGTPYLSQSVPNPFYGILDPSTSRGAQATIQRRALLTQYPQYTAVTMNNQSLGKSWYNAFELRVERRFKSGVSFLASYRVSKAMEARSYLNDQDTTPSRELMAYHTPQRLVLSGIYEFPIGPKKKWIHSGVWSHVIGGWEFSWSGLIQSGRPMSLPDYYIRGNPKLSSAQTLSHWFDTSPQIWVQRPPETLRVTKLRSPNIRTPGQRKLDFSLIRDFHLRERHKLQLKVTAFNSTNTPLFGAPNTTPTSPLFGVVPITQINSPRSVELGLRYVF